MKGDTSIARGVKSVADDYDAACKRLLSEKQILSRLLQGCLHEFATLDPTLIEQECFEGEPLIDSNAIDRDVEAARVRQLLGEDTTTNEGMATFDIRFMARAPILGGSRFDGFVNVEINVEAQNKFSPGYPLLKRGIFYAGRMLSMQGEHVVEGSHYERLHKVVSIWVCAHPAKAYAGTITCFGISPEQKIGNASYRQEDYNMIEIVMVCLNDRYPGSSYGVLGMLEVLLTTHIETEKKLDLLRDQYDIMITKAMEEGVDNMCNLSEGVLEEGRKEGRKEGRAEVVAALIADGVMSLKEATERFGITEQELRLTTRR